MAQERVAHGLKAFRKTIAIPGDRRTREIKRIAFSVQHNFHCIRIKGFFSTVNRRRQRRHTNLALRQVFRHLTNNHRRDHRFIALHVHNNGIVAKTAFFNDFRQTLRPGLMVSARHADFPTRRFYRASDIFMVRRDNNAFSARFARAFQNMHDHRFAVDIQ